MIFARRPSIDMVKNVYKSFIRIVHVPLASPTSLFQVTMSINNCKLTEWDLLILSKFVDNGS